MKGARGNEVASLIGRSLAVITVLTIIVAVVVGCVLNIFAIIHLPDIAQWDGMAIARIIGIFVPPLGAILGYV